MDGRPRVSMRLHDPWMAFLAFRAAQLGRMPAELARDIVEGQLAVELEDPSVRAAYTAYVEGDPPPPELIDDIAAALETPGVPGVLYDRGALYEEEAGRVARFLGLAAEWLADPRPRTQRGPAPRLADVRGTVPVSTDVGAALDVAGGADGAARRGARGEAALAASDKRQLSDTGGAGGGEVRNEWT